MHHAQEQRRKQAVVRYLAGDKIEAICRDLHCSKSWLYKWKARYQADDPTWAKGLSAQPRHKPSQVPQRIEQRVVELRRTLVQRGQHGSAASIQQELSNSKESSRFPLCERSIACCSAIARRTSNATQVLPSSLTSW
jgi:transposase